MMMPYGQPMFNPMMQKMPIQQNFIKKWPTQEPPKKDGDDLGFNEDYGTAHQNSQLAQDALRLMNKSADATGEQYDDIKEAEVSNEEIKEIGAYSLEWLLDKSESEQEFLQLRYFQSEELEQIVWRKQEFDQLYLVKWKNLSYHDATYEPLSMLLDFKHLLANFERANRSLELSDKIKQKKY
jgi:hypothetical protein